MPRRKPPLNFGKLCCPSFEFVVRKGLMEGHVLTYSAGDMVTVEVLIGFVTKARYLHLRRRQHLYECPFCGTALQSVVKATIRDLGRDYGGASPISLAGNPVTGRPATFTVAQLEEALFQTLNSSSRTKLHSPKDTSQLVDE